MAQLKLSSEKHLWGRVCVNLYICVQCSQSSKQNNSAYKWTVTAYLHSPMGSRENGERDFPAINTYSQGPIFRRAQHPAAPWWHVWLDFQKSAEPNTPSSFETLSPYFALTPSLSHMHTHTEYQMHFLFYIWQWGMYVPLVIYLKGQFICCLSNVSLNNMGSRNGRHVNGWFFMD